MSQTIRRILHGTIRRLEMFTVLLVKNRVLMPHWDFIYTFRSVANAANSAIFVFIPIRIVSEIDTYLNALAKEVEVYSRQPAIAGRPLRFVYFGGGTPSYISVNHLTTLVDRIKQVMPWDSAEEVAFECEPGTLTQKKLEAIKAIGVTRLSLGVENLNDEILAENGRAHLSKEVYRIDPWIKELAFDQVNIDLISGMIGETWDSWRETVRKTIELDPDSITVYQLELPFNTVYSKDILGGDALPVADWKLKREWHQYAFEQFCKSRLRTIQCLHGA